MSCSDTMIIAEKAFGKDAFFEGEDYAHTLRTLHHILREQQAEMACLPTLDSGKVKYVFVSPPYADAQRTLLHQHTAISLLSADHPLRTRYITHDYYIFTFEHILI